MRILLWHVHGSWTDAFVRGPHTYLLATNPGIGRAGRDWPSNVVEVSPPFDGADVAIVQDPSELRFVRDLPKVYVEHNTPKGGVPSTRHPLADRDDLVLVHVTHFNDLMWDSGGTLRAVIEHGVPDPGHRYTGSLQRVAAVINEPMRRWRVTGTDLLPRFAETAPVDLYGIATSSVHMRGVAPHGDIPLHELHGEMAQRRAYLHPFRWTSLGLSLIEAMMLGMPVVALATTEAVEAIPPEAGIISTQVDVLRQAIAWLMNDAPAAKALGERAREAAVQRYGLDRFLADWDQLLKEVHG
ncbi:glycosyltransferase [Allorhizocola rhizosphaerae]|uniref:glycosyltransferase n=1 Tax=Allorhizocola rhizosphaerae TaxID=1872709 RepID=UPI000E3CA260|nr:glycosyltransferase [Allorhizocola rhizosphaerae]